MTAALRYEAPPTVSAFMDDDSFVRAIIGPVGSGKSSGSNVEILRRAMEQAPGPDKLRRSRWVVGRNTYQQLRDTTAKTFEQWVPDRLGSWSTSEFTFTMRFRDVRAEVLFRAFDKPKDVRKLLSLELTGAYLNECREIPKDIFDALQTRLGRYPSKAEGGPTWFGMWCDSNPWAMDSDYYELFSVKKPPGHALFEQPDGLSADAENVENLPQGYYERLCHGKDSEWVDEYVRAKYPKHDKGSVYGKVLAELRARAGVCDFEHPSDGVDVVFDLGVSDATAIWWFRIGRDGLPDVVDWYEATGEGFSHFADVLEGHTPAGCDRERKYKVRRIWLPHDARARTFQTNESTVELFSRRFPGRVGIGPELGLADGITAARALLEKPMRFHRRCEPGLKKLGAYRYEWDEKRKVFSRTPVHDSASHTADAFRYLACVVKPAAANDNTETKAKKPAVRDLRSFQLDELWDTAVNTNTEEWP